MNYTTKIDKYIKPGTYVVSGAEEFVFDHLKEVVCRDILKKYAKGKKRGISLNTADEIYTKLILQLRDEYDIKTITFINKKGESSLELRSLYEKAEEDYRKVEP